MFILQLRWWHNWLGTSGDCFVIYTGRVINLEGNILYTISMLLVLSIPVFMPTWVEWRFECELDLTVADNMGAEFSLSGF